MTTQTNQPLLSHNNLRAFQLDKLSPPRDFDIKDWAWITEANDKPLVLEIGAGKGKHAIQFAAANTDKTIIAVERTANKFTAFDKLLQQTSLNNLIAVHADAIAWSVFALPKASVDEIFLLYPNPEPKNINQQWLNMPFFEFLLSRLKDDGQITLASNIKSYIDNAEDRALNHWLLGCHREQISKDSARTHFEIKYLARDEVCEQLILTKPNGYITRFDG